MRRELGLFFAVYATLLVLLALTIGSAFLNLGVFNPVVNLTIAAIKAALVYWFFMELRQAEGLIRLVAIGIVFWISILLAAAAMDWLTR